MATISDPKAMRALAHPLRMQLLELVVARGSATATELAEIVGQSPANCSFHLRKLAEFGYLVRADDATGREKPWRAPDPTQMVSPDSDDEDALQASAAVGAAVREWDFGRMQAADGRRNPPRWRGTEFQKGATMIITPQEAKEIARELDALLAPYHARLTDRSLRPAGAGATRLFAAMTYLPEYQALLDDQAAATADVGGIVAAAGSDPAATGGDVPESAATVAPEPETPPARTEGTEDHRHRLYRS